MRSTLAVFVLALTLPLSAAAQDQIVISPTAVVDWKAVYGRIEARDRIPARARLGGTLVSLAVVEGDEVAAGQTVARVVDEKIDFQLSAIDAQLQAMTAQLENAEAELKRGEELLSRGVTTVQRLDGLRTQVDVLQGQIAATRADRQVVQQRATEGAVLAPIGGRVLSVPVAAGAVVMPGEIVATIGGGGIFLRLAIPERHSAFLGEGDEIQIESFDGVQGGKLARIYPQIEDGRVVADVEVAGLTNAFVGGRVLVRLPVGQRQALLVPAAAVITRSGLDFVAVAGPDGPETRAVVLGQHHLVDGVDVIEVVTGLAAGDTVVTHHE